MRARSLALLSLGRRAKPEWTSVMSSVTTSVTTSVLRSLRSALLLLPLVVVMLLSWGSQALRASPMRAGG